MFIGSNLTLVFNECHSNKTKDVLTKLWALCLVSKKRWSLNTRQMWSYEHVKLCTSLVTQLWHDQEEWVRCRRCCFWDIGKNRVQIPLFYIVFSIVKSFITLQIEIFDKVTHFPWSCSKFHYPFPVIYFSVLLLLHGKELYLGLFVTMTFLKNLLCIFKVLGI